MRSSIRTAGFLALSAAAVAIYIAMAPKVIRDTPTLPSATQYESLIATALSDYSLNNANADSAPQQQVVNGWAAKHLLTIIAKTQADVLKAQGAVVDATGSLQTQPFDDRVPALLVVGILAIAWSSVSAPRQTLTVVSTPTSDATAIATHPNEG
jgi:hypothetical protein